MVTRAGIQEGRVATALTWRSTAGSDEHAIHAGKHRKQELIEKIRRLPAGKLAEVEDFGFLRRRQEERRLAKAATGVSEAAFAKVRHYSGDAASDGL
jgi:hypothetical protein